MKSHDPLLIFRNIINNIDKKIVKLLAERKKISLKIALEKIKNKKEIRDIEREKKILSKLTDFGKKYDLPKEYIIQLFQLIINESVLMQKKLLNIFLNKKKYITYKCSFLGPNGSYSHIAACKYAKKNFIQCIPKPCSTFEEVIFSVENNQSDYGILPVSNTSSGKIHNVINLLKKTNLFIVGEINIFIDHCLLAIKKIELNQIKKIYSHPQPFLQCSNFIKKFPKWQIRYTTSTTAAMEKICKYNEITNAALGSKIGSKIYRLNILCKNITNTTKNTTKFVVVHRNTMNVNDKN